MYDQAFLLIIRHLNIQVAVFLDLKRRFLFSTDTDPALIEPELIDPIPLERYHPKRKLSITTKVLLPNK